MARQLITIGTPGAGGGDPAHVAFKKINDNATELYDAAIPDTEEKKTQARANLGLGGAAVEDLMPVSKGGTGSNGPWGARNNIGALGVGDFGLGALGTELFSTIPENVGFYSNVSEYGEFPYGAYMVAKYNNPLYGVAIGVRDLGGGRFGYVVKNGTWGSFRTIRDTSNTAVDGNGFIKAASPVGSLYSDRIELNEEAKNQPIIFEKLGVGDYIIKGSTGFALEGWYVEQPKDSNGNVYHAVIYHTLDNGDISVKTYAKKMNAIGEIEADLTQPVDIKEGRFIAIRFNELPRDTAAPINPAITDNEGNPAPTKYHILEEGGWIISEEDAAKLEQERLAAMKPLKRRQFRLTLAMNGYDLKEVEILIDQIEDPMQRTIAQIEWQDAGDFERTNPTLLMMAGLLGLDTAAVDQLWEYGLML